ncbi:hypothetical protein Mal15_40640 [Stieleria maiorica]|uniref:Uncharacterized protein n=1 Tax=Stieleria maiorica TaxID=2795974 RepID=A0A5B9MMA3_9BACT|nr:hypothetical protein Mal15_40640 [Stieleria maiorica]
MDESTLPSLRSTPPAREDFVSFQGSALERTACVAPATNTACNQRRSLGKCPFPAEPGNEAVACNLRTTAR